MIIESKVLIPAITGLITAVLALATAFGLDLTEDQRNAILGVAVAVVVALQVVLGYLAPHTARPDLDQAEGARHALRGDHGVTETGAIALIALVVAVVCLIIVL